MIRPSRRVAPSRVAAIDEIMRRLKQSRTHHTVAVATESMHCVVFGEDESISSNDDESLFSNSAHFRQAIRRPTADGRRRRHDNTYRLGITDEKLIERGSGRCRRSDSLGTVSTLKDEVADEFMALRRTRKTRLGASQEPGVF